jgi:hypothetical protein
MKNKTLMYGSILAAGIIVVVLCVGMVTGFSVAKPFISVDPISDKNIGDQFTITGNTSLPAGTEILFQIYPASFEAAATDPQTGAQNGEFTGATGTVTVTQGTGGTNTWSVDVDLTTFLPTEYLVNVSLFTGDASRGDFSTGNPFGTTTFTVHPASGSAVTAGTSRLSDNAAPGGILIDPIRDTSAGDLLVVTGRTNLTVGTDLIVKVIPESTDSARIVGDYQNPENAAITKVVKGSGSGNRFSVSFDTRLLPPAEHIVTVSNVKGNAAGIDSEPGTVTGSYLFNIIAGAAGTSQSGNDTSVPGIFINPVGDTTAGDPLVVSGTTSLPVGTGFIVKVIPESSTDNQHPEIAASTAAVKGSGTASLFSVTLDTTKLRPGGYIVFVSDVKSDVSSGNYEPGQATGSALFAVT